MTSNLDALLKPGSVALIGASPDTRKWGGWLAKQLVECGYKGDIHFISTKPGKIFGREVYRSIFDINQQLDLVIIGIPAPFVLDAVKDCVKKGVKVIAIVTAGFGETGPLGKELELALLKEAAQGGCRIIGPNSLGIYNSAVSLNTSPIRLSPGFFAFITQSGNYALDVDVIARQRGLGYSKWISLGNQSDIRFSEYLDYVKDDPNTKAILLYMEGLFVDSVDDGREFFRIAKGTTPQKPIIAIKAGNSCSGTRAAASHTGSLAGSNEVFDGAFRQAGIIRVLDSSELIAVGEALVKCPMPNSNRIAILSDGGGHGTLTADAAERNGLEVPILGKMTQEKLKRILPPQASVSNPVDFAGGAESDLHKFVDCSEIILQDQGIDGLIIVGQYGGYALELSSDFARPEIEIAHELTGLVTKYQKPVINHSIYSPVRTKPLQILSDGNIPVYATVETAIRCMSSLVKRGQFLRKVHSSHEVKPPNLPSHRLDQVKQIIDGRETEQLYLLETETREILKAYELPVSDSRLATTREDAVRAAQAIGYPVAMKMVSPDITHKSDVGGVKLNLKDKFSVVRAFDEIMHISKSCQKAPVIKGVIITPFIANGTELIIGMTNDQTFGPVVMFGLGGIFVEVLKDVSFRVAPLTRQDAYEMIREIKGYPILKGMRGQRSVDIDLLAEVIMKVAALSIENPAISELDMNPIFALENSISILDSRILIETGR